MLVNVIGEKSANFSQNRTRRTGVCFRVASICFIFIPVAISSGRIRFGSRRRNYPPIPRLIDTCSPHTKSTYAVDVIVFLRVCYYGVMYVPAWYYCRCAVDNSVIIIIIARYAYGRPKTDFPAGVTVV